MRRFFFLVSIGVLGLFSSCKDTVTPPPAGTLPKMKMAEVLIEIHIAETYVGNERDLSQEEALLLFERYEDEIFQKHGVTREAYVQSRNYYADHVEEMAAIYEVVVDSLNARKNVLAPPPSIDTK